MATVRDAEVLLNLVPARIVQSGSHEKPLLPYACFAATAAAVTALLLQDLSEGLGMTLRKFVLVGESYFV